MLRLDLKDAKETVLFIDPMEGVKIHKDVTDSGLFIETGDLVTYVSYKLEKSRDAAYEYVLNKINEYLFPQIESSDFRPHYVGEEV